MTNIDHTDYDASAIFHIPQRKELDPNTGLDVTLYNWARTELIQGVRKQGVDLHITRGKNAFDNPDSVDVLVPEIEAGQYTTARHLGDQALAGYGVIRTISGRLDHVNSIPILTDARVKALATDKLAAADMLSQIGFHEGAHLVLPDQDIKEVLASVPGHNVVLKPRNGARSEGVIVASKAMAAEAYGERDKKEVDYVLEPKLNFETPFPSYIRGYDDVNQARLELANKQGANKEIRTIYFGNGKYFYIARAAKEGEKDFRGDDWVYLDPTTIPGDIINVDQKVVKAIEDRTGLNEFHVAIDKTFATTDVDDDPHWRVMEINAAEPQLVRTDQHPTIAVEQADLLGEQIARIARKRTLQ